MDLGKLAPYGVLLALSISSAIAQPSSQQGPGAQSVGNTPLAATGGATARTLPDWLNLPHPQVPPSGILPAIHLAKFVASSTPTVCVTGDSTMQANPVGGAAASGQPGVTPIDNLSNLLQQRIMQDNPTKTIAFKNFAIGGQTWNTLNGIPGGNFPPFYFNTALPWLPYIQAANCTSLYINMGINDANGMTAGMIRSVLAKVVGWGTAPASWVLNTVTAANTVIKDSNNKLQITLAGGTTAGTAPTWATAVGASTADGTVTWQLLSAVASVASIPDIILITNKNVNVNAGGAYATAVVQTGTLNAAAYQRTLARSGAPGFLIAGLPPMGLIDIGRYFTEAYNGFDPVVQSMATVIPASAPVTATVFPYNLPSTDGDFDISLTIPAASFNSTSQYITLITGSPGSTAGSKININFQNANSYFAIYDASGQTGVGVYTGGIWNAAGNNTFEVITHGERLYIVVNGVLTYDAPVARFSGPFVPQISLINPVASPSITVNYYVAGTAQPYAPILNAATAFGSVGGVQGGNGINHDASQAINFVDYAVLQATRFAP